MEISSSNETPQQMNIKEIEQYYKLTRQFKENKDKYRDVYLIPKEWMTKWKEVTGYADRQNIDFQHYERKGTVPQIDNSVLFVDKESYLKEKEETQSVIDLKTLTDVKAINKDIWDFFVGKYGGGPEVKFTVNPGQSECDIDICYLKINFVILPKKEDIVKEEVLNQLKEYTTYVCINKSVKDISEHIQNVIFDNNLLNKEEVKALLPKEETPKEEEKKEETPKEEEKKEETPEEEESEESEKEDKKEEPKKIDLNYPLRVWRPESISTVEDLSKVLSMKSNKIAKTPGLISPDKITDMRDISNYSKYKISDIINISNLKDSSFNLFFLVEQPPYLFNEKKEITKKGSCEYCRQRTILLYSCKCKEVWYCSESCLERDKRFHEGNCRAEFELETEEIKDEGDSRKGLVGLSNLGNTCFMNTSLQCLSNCYELTQYFLSDKYINDINVDNPIGTRGILAKAYGNLLKHLWYGTSDTFSPTQFKNALGTFQKMFTGFRQHDTQEFLNYLLDGLHEDLNKVLKKPIINKDEEKGSDKVKSHNSWIDFLRRNQSVLVDLFYGQYKSTLKCPNPECKNISIIFEPFLSVSLPLKQPSRPFSVKCFFIFYDLKVKPILLPFMFYKPTNIMALRNKIAKTLNVHPLSFLIGKLESSEKIEMFYSPKDALKPTYGGGLKFFLFQIDPKFFYSSYNTFVSQDEFEKAKRSFASIADEISKNKEAFIEINKEDYVNEESIEDNKDYDNLGFDMTKMIRTTIRVYNELSGDKIVFPRVLFFPLDMKANDLYHYVFKYFLKIILLGCNINDDSPFANKETCDEEIKKLFAELFKDFTKETSINEEIDISETTIPFRLRILASERDRLTFNVKKRIECHKLISYDESITIADIYKEFKASREKNYFHSSDEDEFNLVISWNQKYVSILEKLNNYSEPLKNIDFRTDNSKEKEINIYDCFKKFVKEEILEEHNEWYCSKCKQHQRASKKIDIYKSPNILIIHLKRFSNNSKIDSVVRFPITDLDIREFVADAKEEEEYKYDLFAIANHYGSMGFGHYVAFAKNHFTQQWHEFNDSCVSRKDENDLVGSSAYVLFYRKKGTEGKNYDELYEKKFVEYVNDYIKEEETSK